MGNSESLPEPEPQAPAASPSARSSGGESREEGLKRSKSRLEELEAEPSPPPDRSLLDDLAEWWENLDLEQAAKALLDDIEAAITGCRSLAHVALMPGAQWQPDDARGTCNLCDEAFSMTRRRHHCRHCGLLFCAECADNYIYLTQNKVKFKFRICSDCKDDEATAVNVRENAASSIESVAQVAKAVGRAARHKASVADLEPDAGSDGAPAEAVPLAPVEMPKTELLRKALGMEEGEELSFEFGQPSLPTSSALVATPEDPFNEIDFSEQVEDTPWWEDTFFDGSFEDADTLVDSTLDFVSDLSSDARIDGYLRTDFERERFMTYNDDEDGSAFANLDAPANKDQSFASMVAQVEAGTAADDYISNSAQTQADYSPDKLPEPVE